ncbi:MAG TPA: hypothetical protein VIN59_03995 [Alphaproteobacteria bacterium]
MTEHTLYLRYNELAQDGSEKGLAWYVDIRLKRSSGLELEPKDLLHGSIEATIIEDDGDDWPTPRLYATDGNVFNALLMGDDGDGYIPFMHQGPYELKHPEPLFAHQFGPKTVSLQFQNACRKLVLSETVGLTPLHQATYAFKGFPPRP